MKPCTCNNCKDKGKVIVRVGNSMVLIPCGVCNLGQLATFGGEYAR